MDICIVESEHFETLPAWVDMAIAANHRIRIVIYRPYLQHVQQQVAAKPAIVVLSYDNLFSLLRLLHQCDLLVLNTVNLKHALFGQLMTLRYSKVKKIATIHNIKGEILTARGGLKAKVLYWFTQQMDGYRVLVQEMQQSIQNHSAKPVLFLPAAATLAVPHTAVSDTLNVVIPGAVQQKRRDYAGFIQYLTTYVLPFKLKLVFLGACADENNQHQLKALDGLPNLELLWFQQEVDTLRFSAYMNEAHVMVSPLNQQAQYGAYKTSGAFGDAVTYGKPLFIPDYVPIPEGWNALCKHYQDWDDLFRQLAELHQNGQEGIQDQEITAALAQFSAEKYLERFKAFYPLL